MKKHEQILIGIGVGVGAAYVFNLLKQKGLLPGISKHVA